MPISGIELQSMADDFNDYECRCMIESCVNVLMSGPESNIDIVFKALNCVLNVEELAYLRDQLHLELEGAIDA